MRHHRFLSPLTHLPAALAIVLWCAPARATTYHVSASAGLDQNSGTAEAPFATISTCAGVAVAGDTCLVHAGTYRETVSPARSGTPEQPVVFRAADGECVTVSGADPLPAGFTQTQPNIWVAPLSAPVAQLFSNDVMVWEAQWPNRSPGALMETPKGVAGEGTGPAGSDWAVVDPKIPAGDWTGATIFMLPGQRWASVSRPVKAYNPTTHSLTLDMSTPWAHSAMQMAYGNPYYLYDSLLALDAQDEWVQKSGSLYYFSTDDPALHGLTYKARAYAFVVRQSYVQLIGFHVFGAAVRIEGAHNVVDSLTIEYPTHLRAFDGWKTLGDINLISGDANVWKNSLIRKSASSGIGIQGNGNLVENNIVEDAVYQATNQAGIDMWTWATPYSDNLFIRNTVDRSGRAGIYLQGTQGGRVLYNRISSWALLTYDMGGIYTGMTDGAGTEIAYNDLGGSTAMWSNGIYLDNVATHFVVHHNYIHDSAYFGACLSPETYFFSNTFANVGSPFAFSSDADTGQGLNDSLSQARNNLTDGKLLVIVGVLPSAVTDWGYFQFPLRVSETWQHIEIPFSSMQQRTSAVQVPFNLGAISSLSFSPVTNGDFELDLDNLQAVGASSRSIDGFDTPGAQNTFGGWVSAGASGDGVKSTGMTLTYESGGPSGLHAHVTGTVVGGSDSWGSLNESLPNVDLSNYTGLAFDVRGRLKSLRPLTTGGSPVQDHNASCSFAGTAVPACAIDQGVTITGITGEVAGAGPDVGAFESGTPAWGAGAARSNDATFCGKIADVGTTLPPRYGSPWLKEHDAGVPDAARPDGGAPDAAVPDAAAADGPTIGDAGTVDSPTDSTVVTDAHRLEVAALPADAPTDPSPDNHGVDASLDAKALADMAPQQTSDANRPPDTSSPDAASADTRAEIGRDATATDTVKALAPDAGDAGKNLRIEAGTSKATPSSGCSCDVGRPASRSSSWFLILAAFAMAMALRRSARGK